MKIKFKYSKPIDPFIPGAWVTHNNAGSLLTWGNNAWRICKRNGDLITLVVDNEERKHQDWNIHNLKVVQEGISGITYRNK